MSTTTKTVYWSDIEVRNMSATVEIPNDIVAKGNLAMVEYLEGNKDSLRELATHDDTEVASSFENMHMGNL